MDSFGERLLYARKKRVFSQKSLADLTGVPCGVIDKLEKNQTEPQGAAVNSICQILRINREWLVHGDGEMDIAEAASSAAILDSIYQAAEGLSESEQLFLLDMARAMRQRFGKHDK